MSTATHLLDTDIASYIVKGRAQSFKEKLASIPPDRLVVSAITRAEMMYGLKRLPTDHHLHLAVQQFFKIVQIIPWTASAADHYAEIRHQLISSGQPIGELDMMIAAHAISIGAILVSNNTRHFERINAPLLMDNWLEN